jgi:PAS domain S-box-containing protein
MNNQLETDPGRTGFAAPKSEAEYRLLFEANPHPMYVCDQETLAFLAVNDAAVRHYGYSRQEFLAMSVKEIRPAEEVPALLNHIAKITGTHDSAGEWRHRKKNGTVIDVEVTWHKLDFAGRPSYLVLANDITSRKQAEIALRESEERYRELFENANDLIYTHDLAGNFSSLNKSGEQLTGYTQEEARTMNIRQVVAPEHLKTARNMIAHKTVKDNVPTVYELDIIAKNGRRISLELSTRLIYREGEPFGVQGIGRDISERKRTEAEIIRRNQELSALNEIGHELSKLAEPTEIAKLLHSVIGKVLDNRNLYVALYDEQKQEVSFPAYTIDGKPYYTAARKLGQGLTEYVIRTRKPLLIPRDLRTALTRLGLVASGRHAECWLAVPMLVGDKIVGVITIQDYDTPEAYDTGHLELLSTIASQAASVIENARLYAEMKQHADRIALTNRISQAVRRTLDVSEVFQTAVSELGAHLGVDRCSLFVVDKRAERATNAAEYDAPGVKPTGREFELPQLESLIAAVQQHGVLAFDDVQNDQSMEKVYRNILKPFGVQSVMYVGVSVGDRLLGAFALSTTKRLRRWSEADVELARAVADQTGMAIRQAKLYEKAEATSVRESLANKLSLAIRASLSLADVLSTATRELGTALSASRIQVRLCDVASRERAVVHEYLAPDCGDIRQAEDAYDNHLRRHFLSSPKPLVIDDAQQYSGTSPEFDDFIRAHAQRTGVRSELDYPLTVSGQYRGVISIHQAGSVRRWTEDEVTLVESVATQLATGIAQAELFHLVERGKKDWESTFDAMSDGIFIFDRAGRLMRVNRAGAAMENTTPEMLLGRQCCNILRAGSTDATCVVEQAVRQSKSVTIELVPDLLNRPLLVSAEPVLDKSRKTSGVVCIARDLSELRQVEAVARERQTLLRNILESAREAIYALDTEGRYLWCNQAMLDLTGYKPEELIGHAFLDRTHEDDREMRRERFVAVLAGEPQSFESRYLANDGSVRYALVNNAPIVVDGATTGVLGIARDVTEQKQERERASRADKLRALGQLASGVAHDFNNSLAAILGRAQLMQRQVQDDALLRNLSIIVTAAEDAAATVRRIQTFARKSQIKEFELLDVGSLLHDAFEITRTRWQNEARAAGINIEVKLNTDDEVWTLGNASELREVFVNLIVNAVDAMPQGGQLKICAIRKGDRLRLRFSDTGTGMTDEVRAHVFEPFYTTKGARGTGLGLAVSYGIIERHEGTISVESKLGKGTTLLIHLPAAEPEEAVPAADSEAVTTTSLSVLVIDDEPVVRDTLAAMLADLDHRVVTADGGREALAKVASTEFDLVFTDLAMPGMDGWETAREIHKRRPELPVVLVTGYGATTTPPESEPDLIAGIIGKPFDFDQVTGTLAKVCNGSGAGA